MSELLIEIFSAEIPALMQEEARIRFEHNLVDVLSKIFVASRLKAQSWVTPQRLGAHIQGIVLESVVGPEEVRGPKIDAPEQAYTGFLRKYNLTTSDLYMRDAYYYARVSVGEGTPQDMLKTAIIAVLKQFVWPKSMIDGAHDLRWVRPMKSILCLLDGKVLPFHYHHLSAGNTTYGHKFMSHWPLEIRGYTDYKAKLEAASVVLEGHTRRQSILSQTEALLKNKNVKLIMDDRLLTEIVGLVEYPKVFLAKIPEKFMLLPREVLITTIKQNQRYLMTEDARGNLASYYLIVANIEPEDGGAALLEGNHKVLCARLEDAKFFYEQDIKQPLDAYIEVLRSISFNALLGSIYDKQVSVAKIASKLAVLEALDSTIVERAVMLTKCDLATHMVKEFPELQGVMGYYYAIHHNEPLEIASAIKDHYKPQGPNDILPQSKLGAIVALADKLDTLEQMFRIGIKPTGSKDPFGLRRAAIGVIRIVEHYGLTLDYQKLGMSAEVIEFIERRKNA